MDQSPHHDPRILHETCEEEDRLKQAGNVFDDRLKSDPAWIASLQKKEIFSETELRRIGFLVAVIPVCGQESVNGLGDVYRELCESIANRLHLLLRERDEQKGVVAGELRWNLMKIEEMLEHLRVRKHAEVDSQLLIGKKVLSVREEVGAALGGGGNWGFSHIGVLEKWQYNGIPLGKLGVVSMGSIVGGVVTAFVDQYKQILPESIPYMTKLARNVQAYEQLSVKRGDKNVVPFDELLCPPGEEERYQEMMKRKPCIPFFAQVARHHDGGKGYSSVFLHCKEGETMEAILRIGGIAAASSALRPKLSLDPVIIGDATYSDDYHVLQPSILGTVRKLRDEKVDIVISVPVGLLDTDVWKWGHAVRKLAGLLRGKPPEDHGDIVIQPKEWHGLISGMKPWGKGTLTNIGKGLFGLQTRYPTKKKDLKPDGSNAIASEEFIQAGRDAAEKKMPEILRRLGLRPLTGDFKE